MEGILAGLETTAIAQTLRSSRWGYAAVSATHIFGLALLIGSIMPLNLRILGCWRFVGLNDLARVMIPVAIAGLAIAAIAGLLLFSVRAGEYAGSFVVLLKLTLVTAGTLSALTLLARFAGDLEAAPVRSLRLHALISIVCWTAALVCGRLIAFVTS